MEERIALVTGVGRGAGIGAAIARALAHAGVHVFITYWQPYDQAFEAAEGESAPISTVNSPQALAAELQALGVRSHAAQCDLAQPDAAPALFDQVAAALGPVDILVNNAAYSTRDGVDGLTAEILDAHYAVNLRGTALLCVEFARRFRKTKGGRIINLTSGQSTGPMPDELAYAATKGAIDALTVSLAGGLASRGITVNAVDPGPTDTGWIWPELRRELEATAPQGRVGLPEDAARLVRFLASADAAWITGQIIHSRGGL